MFIGVFQNIVNGLSFGMLLFVVAAGLTLVFGVMRVVNMTHGSMYLFGGYIAASLVAIGAGFGVGLVAGMAAMAAYGILLDRGLLERYGQNTLAQVLLTFGGIFILSDLGTIIWGTYPVMIQGPDIFRKSFSVGAATFSSYRLIVIGVGIAIAIFLWWFLERTKYGALIRATVDDEGMVRAMSVNTQKIRMLVFAIGGALAGLGGVFGGSFAGLNPGFDTNILLLSFIVVLIGGAGSLKGALIGGLITGLAQTLSSAYVPFLSISIIYIPMIVLLIFRPEGLFGKT